MVVVLIVSNKRLKKNVIFYFLGVVVRRVRRTGRCTTTCLIGEYYAVRHVLPLYPIR